MGPTLLKWKEELVHLLGTYVNPGEALGTGLRIPARLLLLYTTGMKYDAWCRSEIGGTTFCVEASSPEEALSKARAEVGSKYPVIEIRDYINFQAIPQTPGYQGCLMAMPPVLAQSRIGDPRNPYFPHLPL